ncbi:alpha/beta fold hydrolase [Bremerella cremea]|uniref:Alpha/beta fold hydrolase n=1 Tax=Bremerella cremea TaxID=1031537 RepID=A0A368KY02_9BACT|nr:alpha/beta fold hydrolase [Bremerella cremea]RCS56171.1 alpha/beta fold hydrolase [Bremerella cremea]
MVRWKPTFATLGITILIIQIASGCAMCRKGRWVDPKMVAPCPESNPKSQYPFGIWCNPCDVTSLETFSPDDQAVSLASWNAPAETASPIQRCAYEEAFLPGVTLQNVSSNAAAEEVIGRPIGRSSAMPNAVNQGGEQIETPQGSPAPQLEAPFLEPGPEFFQGDLLEGETLYLPSIREQPIPQTESADVQLRQAETYYAMAVDADKQLDESAMNMFLDAAIAAYRYLQLVPPQPKTTKATGRAWEVYHSSIARLIFIAERTGHIDKKVGIKLPVNGSYRIVEFEYINFQRTAEDFDCWHVVGDYQSRYLLTKHKTPGLGVPLVVERVRKPGDRWYPDRLPFAATAILRPECEVEAFDATTEAAIPDGTHVEQVVARLELYDPKQSGDVELNCHQVPLAKDTTAPYAFLLSNTRGESTLEALHPMDNVEDRGLFVMEPHRKGKIPVVFVHGLLSAPYTWAGIANEIDSNPDLAERYEIWAFHYPTGAPFMETAAIMREQLHDLIQEIDPSGFDRDLRNVVLVGHSMGGLLAKLQITDSGNTLWEHVAFQPVNTLDTDPKMSAYLRRMFYFTHSPSVGRVVFIGTPHQGSSYACGKLGHVSAALVHQDPSLIEAHKKLIENNPAAFRKEMRTRFPTSFDVVNPDSLLLEGIYRLPLPRGVSTHTILGNGWWTIHDGQSDGVVPVSSARLPGVQTEIMVNSKHTHLNRDAGTVCEVLRILRVHGTKPAFAG